MHSNEHKIGLPSGFSRGRITIPDIAFLFGLVSSVKVFLIFLFFRENPAAGTAVGTLLTLLFIYFLSLVAVASSKRHIIKAGRISLGEKLIITYVVWSGLSLLWSRADPLLSAFGYWVASAGEILVIIMLCSFGEINRVAESFLRGMVLGALCTAGVALFSGISAGSRLGDGDFLHPNTLGNQMAIGALCSMYLCARPSTSAQARVFWMTVAMLLLVTLLKTLSKTAIVAFWVAITIWILISKISYKTKLVIILLITLIFVTLYQLLLSHITEYVALGGGVVAETLSGRTLLWEETWAMIKAKPVLGYGFMSFRSTGPQIFLVRADQAHNEWLQLWFSLGIGGLILALLIYVGFAVITLKKNCSPSSSLQAALGTALLAYALTRGITEGNALGLVFPLPLLLLMFRWLSHGKVVQATSGHIRLSQGLYRRAGTNMDKSKFFGA